MTTFSLRNKVRVCIKAPAGDRECHRFRLRAKGSGMYGFDIRWGSHFTNRGPGKYRVKFRQSGYAFGPGVSFRV